MLKKSKSLADATTKIVIASQETLTLPQEKIVLRLKATRTSSVLSLMLCRIQLRPNQHLTLFLETIHNVLINPKELLQRFTPLMRIDLLSPKVKGPQGNKIKKATGTTARTVILRITSVRKVASQEVTEAMVVVVEVIKVITTKIIVIIVVAITTVRKSHNRLVPMAKTVRVKNLHAIAAAMVGTEMTVKSRILTVGSVVAIVVIMASKLQTAATVVAIVVTTASKVKTVATVVETVEVMVSKAPTVAIVVVIVMVTLMARMLTRSPVVKVTINEVVDRTTEEQIQGLPRPSLTMASALNEFKILLKY